MLETLTSFLTINSLFYIGLFIAGLFVGSFLNVVSDRITKKKSILFGRSECDHCHKPLGAKDLIPLLSFIFSKGKCRHCGEKLSFYYPVSELLTGISFAGLAYFINLFANTQNNLIWVLYAYFLIVFSAYIVLFLTDVKFRLIPNRVVIPTIIFVIAFFLFNYGFTAISSYYQLKNDEFGQYLLEAGYWQQQFMLWTRGVLYTVASSVGLMVFFWALTKIKDGKAMGGGDVKLALLIGFVNGYPYNILAIFLGFLSGALYSLVLMALRKKGLKDTVAFGPFLIFGSIVALFFGPIILSWYFNLF